jgi:hypothetical protein
MCKVILRNDYWCKGLGQTQPKSEAYGKFLAIKERKKQDGKLIGYKVEEEQKEEVGQIGLFH